MVRYRLICVIFKGLFFFLVTQKTSNLPIPDVESSVNTSTPAASSHKTLKESYVKEALRQDKGDDLRLLSWTLEDVTQKGNNYISDITSVKVKYSRSAVNHEVTYIVKLKRRRENDEPTYMDNMTFNKEGQFFTELLPLMNSELTSAGLRPLQIPRCYHTVWEENQNQIFLEDLRQQGFKVPDRKKGMDVQHSTLVLQELGKLHAASHLLQKKEPQQNLTEKFKFLSWEWFNYTEKSREDYCDLLSGSMVVTSRLAKAAGYENAAKWFEDVAPGAVDMVEKQMEGSQAFGAICHGDCCLHNLMFRYNDVGEPVAVMLLDLQVCRLSSLATDLNYFLLSSLDEPERTAKLDQFLLTYHDAFKNVVEAGGVAMPFTPSEIKQEFHKKNTYGVIMASLLIPLFVAQSQEIPDSDCATGGRVEEYVEQQEQLYRRMLDNNPLLRPRLANLFEVMSRYGVLN